MTAMLRIAGDGGTCCACGDVDGCDCRKCSKLECRSRGGIVRLCGFPEFGDPSTPPRFFLEKQIGGSAVICDYHTPPGQGHPPCYEDCDSPVGVEVQVGYSWDCPGGPAGGADTFGATTLRCIDAYPGGSGVELKWVMETAGSSSASPPTKAQGWGYINSILFAGATAGNGPAYFTRSSTAGTKLGVSAEIAANCSPVGPATGYPTPGGVGQIAYSGQAIFEYCVPRYTSTRYAYSGTQTHDPLVSCEDLATDSFARVTIDQPKGCVPDVTGGASQATDTAFEPALSAYVETDTSVSSQTLLQQKGKAGCIGDMKVTACDRYELLNGEDTDEDARLRLLSGPGGVWSLWQIVFDGEGETCENPECCRAAWEIRTDRTAEYREAEWRATIEGLDPGDEVTIKIKVYRRAYGSPTWALFEELEYDVAATGPAEPPKSAQAQVTGVTPNDEGFETYVACSYSEAEEAP